jgi:transposase-like protein
MRLKVILATIGKEPGEKPKNCPKCGSRHVGHWQTKTRQVRDTKVGTIQVERWYCRACQATFQTVPEGITQAVITRRLKSIGVMLYLLGLSYRGVEDALTALGHPMCANTVYNAVQEAAERIPGLKQERVFEEKRTVALGADITGVKVKGKWVSLGLAVDDVEGIVLTVDRLTSQTGEALHEWLAPIVQQVGAEVVVTDDAENFRKAVTKLALPHQICKAHVVRNTEALIEELIPLVKQDREDSLLCCGISQEQAEADLRQLRTLIHTRQPEDESVLRALHGHYRHAKAPKEGETSSVAYRLRLLFLDRWNLWPRLTCYRTWKGSGGETIDGTNNGCERPIGWSIKERYRSMRGYKRLQSALNVSRLLVWSRNFRTFSGADFGFLVA